MIIYGWVDQTAILVITNMKNDEKHSSHKKSPV